MADDDEKLIMEVLEVVDKLGEYAALPLPASGGYSQLGMGIGVDLCEGEGLVRLLPPNPLHQIRLTVKGRAFLNKNRGSSP